VERHASGLTGGDYLSTLAILTLELENLRAAAAWCIDQARWTELGHLCHCTLFFAIQATPIDGVSWRQQIIDHRSGLDDHVVIEALSELAYLQANCVGDHVTALAIADDALAKAEAIGQGSTPWASTARVYALSMAARYEETVVEASRALQAAELVGDDAMAVITLGTLSTALAGLGEREQSTAAAAEALRRAEASGHPVHLGAAVISHAAGYLTQIPTPEFDVSWEILNRHPETRAVGGTNAMWFDLLWGWCLLGLGEAGEVEWLSRAAISADRLNSPPVSDVALRLLAFAFDRNGYGKEARVLAHYVERNLQAFRFPAPGQIWVDEQLEMAGISRSTIDGVEYKRGEVMTLVNTTAFSIGQGRSDNSGSPPPRHPR